MCGLACCRVVRVSINVDNEIIEYSNSVKLLGVTIDNKLDANEHISNLCQKVNVKLHALARISNLTINYV